MSTEPASVSLLLQQLRKGDDAATSDLWKRYVGKLLPLARRRLIGLRGADVDEDDVLVSVFDRFFRAAKEDRFAKLENRDDLWQILLMLTERRVADQYRRSHAEKRGGGDVMALEDIHRGASTADAVRELADRAVNPDLAAEFADQLRAALERLQEESTREVAILRMEGHSVSEIAEQLGISLSSAERKLRLIRQVWTELNASA